MTHCPRAGCRSVATEIVNNVGFCARCAGEERRLIAGRPKRPDPLGLSAARQVLTKMLPMIDDGHPLLTFNDLGEPTELRIGARRYRVFPR